MALVGLDFGSFAPGSFSIFLLFLEEELSTDSRRPRSFSGDASSVEINTVGERVGNRGAIVQSALLESSPYLLYMSLSNVCVATSELRKKGKGRGNRYH